MPKPTPTDDDLIDLLKEIREKALTYYPWPPDAPPNDDRLVYILGQIIGLATVGINQHKARSDDD